MLSRLVSQMLPVAQPELSMLSWESLGVLVFVFMGFRVLGFERFGVSAFSSGFLELFIPGYRKPTNT